MSKTEAEQFVGPGLPKVYSLADEPDNLPVSPFEEINPGQLCVQMEGFKYTGSIVIPQSAKRRSTAGRIVDAHPESKYKRGDRILFTQFAGAMIHYAGAAGMRVMTEQEVLGKLKQNIIVKDEEE